MAAGPSSTLPKLQRASSPCTQGIVTKTVWYVRNTVMDQATIDMNRLDESSIEASTDRDSRGLVRHSSIVV